MSGLISSNTEFNCSGEEISYNSSPFLTKYFGGLISSIDQTSSRAGLNPQQIFKLGLFLKF